MVQSPDLDGRESVDIREGIKRLAPYYLDDWDPAADDVGAALTALFANMAGSLTERVDRAPRKHQIAFYEALGFDRRPPQAATVPVIFEIDEDAPHNVKISGGTELEAETEDGEEVFRIGAEGAFEATPARLARLYSVDPDVDGVFAHHDAIGGDESSVFFEETSVQDHLLYIGHAERLAVEEEPSVSLRIETDHDPTVLEWAYYGESAAGAEGWWTLDPDDLNWAEGVLDLEFDGPAVETAVNGIESAWIRARIPSDERPVGAFDMHFADIRIQGASKAASIDGIYANDVPQSIDDGTIFPFGAIPQQRDTFYLSSEEALTKTDARVTITFEDLQQVDEDEIDTEPRISWEYFDGSSWQVLLDGGDAVFHASTEQTTLSFTVPEDLESTAVMGREGFWIRGRLVAGEYVAITYEHTENAEEPDESQRSIDGDPPSFQTVGLEYSYLDEVDPAQLIAKNALEYSVNLVRNGSPYRPFEPIPDDDQTVYLGFESSLVDGPIQLYVEIDEREYPGEFDARVRWEHLVDDTWERIPGVDGTDGFTRSGIVSLAFPEATRPSRRFGEDLHWVRARVRGDTFEPPADWAPGELSETLDDGALAPCRPMLETDPGGSVVRPAAPDVAGIHHNAGMAANVTIVDDEILGSSDGSPGLEVQVSEPPTIAFELWVDESSALSREHRERLEADCPDDIDVERSPSGAIGAVWVRWEAVDDLAATGESDRHYELDRVDGSVTFGDGTAGRIPPHGTDNIRASYRTGGGDAGNVSPGAIEDLITAITHVDAVTNPVEGSGGAPAEETAEVLDRAPRELRDRGRAVTAEGYERIAMDAVRELAEVRCLRGLNPEGEREPGWVTVLVVPDESQEMPEPSVRQRDLVQDALREHAPFHLVNGPTERLIVRGPTYVPVSIEATIVVDGSNQDLGDLEAAFEDGLTAFLHPLHGQGGNGWGFGQLPTISNVIAELEAHEAVDHVPDLLVHFEGAAGRETITKGDTPPEVSPDVLIMSGSHDFVVRPRERMCVEES